MIGAAHEPGRGARSCGVCRLFSNAPALLERSFPGLSSLSSAHASVRADDGLCVAHQRYVTAAGICDRYAGRADGA